MFSYTALETARHEFRLLHLHQPGYRGSRREDVICSLETAAIGETNYETLSYTWGNGEELAGIVVNGTKASVTIRLREALVQLRYLDATRVLWVDALCINQNDLQERRHQVDMMGQIYSLATSVIVWLGPSWEGSELAFQAVARIGGDAQLHLDPQHEHHLRIENLSMQTGIHFDETSLQAYMTSFFNQPWWYRVWTVQEYCLAKKTVVRCGELLLEGSAMESFATNMLNHVSHCCRDIVPSIRYRDEQRTLEEGALEIMDLVSTRERTEPSFLITLLAYTIREASDPRDKMYGLLGLLPERDVGLLAPDYERGLQASCAALVEAWADSMGNLDFLSHVDTKRAFPSQSFVPNWAVNVFYPGDHFDFRRRLRWMSAYHAAPDEKCDFRLCPGGRAVITGTIADKIIEVGGRVRWGDYAGMVNEATDIAKLDQCGADTYEPTGQSLQDAFLLTMVTSLVQQDHEVLVRRRADQRLHSWREWIAQYSVVSSMVITSTSEPATLLKEDHYLFRAGVVQRKFIRTESGYIGWGPWECEAGDVVAILLGGRVPYVLRPQGNQDIDKDHQCFSVIGDSYIHGLMHGELFRDAEAQHNSLGPIQLV